MENSYGLIVGVGQRVEDDGIAIDAEAMQISSADAEKVQKELISRVRLSPDNARCLTNKDATRARILEELGRLAEITKDVPARMIVIYFSGHGCVIDDKHYLICNDTSNANVADTTDNINGRGIAGSLFVEKLQAIQADKMLILLDCCHSGSVYNSIDIPFEKETILAKPNRAIISACDASEVSYLSTPLSIFTYALVEGLAGKFFEGGATDVTLFNLAMYLRERVYPLSGQQQRPQINVLPNTQTSDFVIVRYPNGEPRPAAFDAKFSLLKDGGKGVINTRIAPERDEELRKQFDWIGNKLDEIRKRMIDGEEPSLSSNDRSNLKNKVGNEGYLFDYQYQYTEFTSRNTEMNALRDFLESDSKFCWWMLTGPGGTGKSRLALEIAGIAREKCWNAGFYDLGNNHDWSHWNAEYPTFIIIDYALTDVTETARMLKEIGNRAQDEHFSQKVRVLLLDRIITNEWKSAAGKTGIRDYTYHNPENNFLELTPLEKGLWPIILDIIKNSTLEQHIKDALEKQENEILNQLEKIDPLKRPLFAFFAGKALIDSKGRSIRGWNVHNLLNFHLDALERDYWKNLPDFPDKNDSFKKLLLINTLCRALDIEQIKTSTTSLHLNLTPERLAKVYPRISDSKAKDGNAPTIYIGMQPDILGEYFVLKFCNQLAFDSENEWNDGPKETEEILLNSWKNDKKGVALTIYHLWQDFLIKKTDSRNYDFLGVLLKHIGTSGDKEDKEWLSVLYGSLGYIYLHVKDYIKMVEFLNQSIALNPNYVIAYINRGSAKNDLGDYQGALKDFDRAITLNPNEAMAYYNRAAVKDAIGDQHNAKVDYDQAIALNPAYLLAYGKNILRKKVQDIANLNPTLISNIAKEVDKYNHVSTEDRYKENQAEMTNYDQFVLLNPDSAMAYYYRGYAKIRTGDSEGVLEDFDRAIVLNPDFEDAYFNRGNVKKSTGDYDGATADYEHAISLYPFYSVVYYDRGNENYKNGDYKRALADFDRFIVLNPDNIVAYSNRGITKYRANDFEGAIVDFNHIIALDDKDETAYFNRGCAKNKSGNFQRAIADFDMAINLNPKYAMAYFFRGNVKNDLRDYPAAIADYDRTIDLIPEYLPAYNNRGNAKIDLKDYDGAIADFDHLISLNPDNAHSYLSRGYAKDKGGDYEGAISDYDRATALKPDYLEVYTFRANAKYNKGDYYGAFVDFNYVLALNPDNTDAYDKREIAYSKINNHSGIITDVGAAVELNPSDPVAYYNRGLARDRAGDYDGATEDYEHAVALNPAYSLVYYKRGEERTDLGDYPGAIADYSRFIVFNPNEASTYFNRAIVKGYLFDYNGAIADFDAVIALNPNDIEAYYNRGNAKNSARDYEGAIADYDHAIVLDPNYEYAYCNRGISKNNIEDYEGAITDFNSAIALDSNDSIAYYGRGDAKDNKGDYEGAIIDFARAFDLDPDKIDARNKMEIAKGKIKVNKGA